MLGACSAQAWLPVVRQPGSRYRSDDIEQLLPTWREKVRELMLRLGELGFKPVLFDGLRTLEEAKRNAAKGVGIVKSIHCYGAAADLICDQHGWSCQAARCRFYDVLGREAEALGMVWGARFSRADMPHVQGIPVRWQAEMRALGTEPITASARDELVRAHFDNAPAPRR